MLVLSRKVGECIVLDNGVEITLLEVGRGKARIGIVAPNDVSIMRSELLTTEKQTQLSRRYQARRRDDAADDE